MSNDLVIDQGFVLPVDYGINADNPLIGYQSILETATLTASSQTTTEPVTNLRNGTTYLAWQAETAGSQTIHMDCGSAVDVDYLGLAVHNIGTAGSSIVLEYSTNNTDWSEAISSVTPATDGVIFIRFESASARYWRLSLTASSGTQLRIAVLYIGQVLVLQRRIYTGHSPSVLARKTTLAQGRSEQGHFLGRVLKFEFLENSIDQKNLTPEWVRSKLMPFLEAARLSPFFWAWRPASYPNECGFGWFMDDPTVTNQGAGRLMQAQFKIQSIRL